MRRLTSHVVNGLNEALSILVVDEPGPGGAHHKYTIHAGWKPGSLAGHDVQCDIDFQKGPIGEGGITINGISNESLLAVVEDRLKCFQAGQFSCRENAIALTHVQDALHWLHHRTDDRVARGVEGTSQK